MTSTTLLHPKASQNRGYDPVRWRTPAQCENYGKAAQHVSGYLPGPDRPVVRLKNGKELSARKRQFHPVFPKDFRPRPASTFPPVTQPAGRFRLPYIDGHAYRVIAFSAGATNFSGTRPVSPDGQRKERTDPESAAARREFRALQPPAVRVLHTLSSARSARVSCRRPYSAKLPRQARFGPAFSPAGQEPLPFAWVSSVCQKIWAHPFPPARGNLVARVRFRS